MKCLIKATLIWLWFGRPFIANPDFVSRLQHQQPLAELDGTTLFGGNEHGYTDYPTLG